MPQEVEYIRKERSTLFRANQALTDPSEIKEKVRYLQVTASFLPCACAQLAGAWSAHRWEAALTDGPFVFTSWRKGRTACRLGCTTVLLIRDCITQRYPPSPPQKSLTRFTSSRLSQWRQYLQPMLTLILEQWRAYLPVSKRSPSKIPGELFPLLPVPPAKLPSTLPPKRSPRYTSPRRPRIPASRRRSATIS